MISSHGRRLDVLIKFDSFGIAIENKPWAGEQTNQIHDYVVQLNHQFAGSFLIVYLSPNGAEPMSIDETLKKQLLQQKKLVLSAYRGRLRDWLDRCYQVCAAEKIRWFLQDFMAYAEQTFSAETSFINEPANE